MTQKQALLNLLRTSKAYKVSLIIRNADMFCSEKVTFMNPDFAYKANYIDSIYSHDLRMKKNSKIQITGIQISEHKEF